MTNTQLYLAIGIPMLFNAVLIGVLLSHMNTRFDDLKDLWRGGTAARRGRGRRAPEAP
jgi:ABC-type polysaccharide/polyol phosphate export permease